MHTTRPSKNAAGDGLNDYLRLIKRTTLLTPDEELHLAGIVQEWLNHTNPPKALIKSGIRAKNRMVSANLRLVALIGLKYKDRIGSLQLEMLDLLQAGNLGLIRAVELFDPTRGYKFSTYAFWWIREAVTNAMREGGSGIRIPKTILSLAFRAERLQASSDQVLSTSMVAKRLGESERRVENSLRTVRECRTTSLDRKIGIISEDICLMDLIRDEKSLIMQDDYQWLLMHVQTLDSREKHLLQLRFGAEKSRSYAEVADSMGMSKGQVQSLERRVLRKLRHRLTPVPHPREAGAPLTEFSAAS
ncbi:sigma-70 family RNA polymerase sigma factor [Synechococcus sp. CS-1329]|uniref:sigma-70 family RNA polymerase sigma factor n=1 Tax=Synechococcus sp. CS-1329 TaxID=2847975 RepID=UPI00223A7673|nr:sigma-70 family RNA polymerase sigma factor [Synechococcus sp. CS-1329]MCT0219033.1 sigma-70 family RNA polymerase sigma factor [Synechococcus sp. CS-1329]